MMLLAFDTLQMHEIRFERLNSCVQECEVFVSQFEYSLSAKYPLSVIVGEGASWAGGLSMFLLLCTPSVGMAMVHYF